MNGQQNGEVWSPESFRALRNALRRSGLITLNLWPEMPELSVTLDMSGMEMLIIANRLDDKMLEEKEKAMDDAAKALEADRESPRTWHEITRVMLEYQDYILGALIVKPKYYMMDELPPGLAPDDGVCIHDFTPDMRHAIIKVARGGEEELANFRTDPMGYASILSEQIVRAIASGNDTTGDNPEMAESALQSGDLAEGSEARKRARSKSGVGD